MTGLNSKDGMKKNEKDHASKQNQITQVNKKGKTLGAQHASHGDNAGRNSTAGKGNK